MYRALEHIRENLLVVESQAQRALEIIQSHDWAAPLNHGIAIGDLERLATVGAARALHEKNFWWNRIGQLDLEERIQEDAQGETDHDH